MVAKNDITGDSIQTRESSKAFEDNYEKIFGTKTKKRDDEYWARLAEEAKAKQNDGK